MRKTQRQSKQKYTKTGCRQWGKEAKMLDGGVCRTRAVTGTNQTKIKRRITGCHHAQPKKGGELPGEWAPRADHRRLTRPELEAAWAEDG